MTDTRGSEQTGSDSVFHLEQDSGGVWWRMPENVRYGRPEMLKEKKASHTRRLRPMECDVFHALHDNAKQWEAFVGRVRQHDSALVGGTNAERAARMSRDLRVPVDVVERAMAETFVIEDGPVDETD